MIAVDEREFARLLGYPPGRQLEGDVLARAEAAEAWYREHGRPRVYTVEGVAGITAGIEVEREIDRLWAGDRVDEAYFLDRYAAAVVEALARSLGTTRSPGHDGFPLEEQATLFARLQPSTPSIRMLPSGMLTPRHSLLATYVAVPGEPASPCRSCGMTRCRFRRGRAA